MSKAAPAFEDLKVVVKPIGWFKPDPRNARTHSAEQLAMLADGMRRHGVRWPALARADGTLIAGHGRTEAAKLAGHAHYPTFIAPKDWTDEQCREFMIADNRHAENADWDFDLLRAELDALGARDDDDLLSSLGFDDEDLADLFARGRATGDPEDAPEPPAVPIVQRGDVWILGRHRLMCGDSTNAEDVAKALAGEKPHLCVTDPPYGVEYDADWRNKALRADGTPSDGRAVGKVSNDDRVDWREAWDLFSGAVIYCWHAGASAVQSSIEASGFKIRCQIIWAKSRFVIGRGDYHWQHEPCWYAVRPGRRSHWQGARDQVTLWDDIPPHTKSETGHSTQKPIECMARPIRNNSKPGDFVYEPFAGSGTTLIACELEGRRCLAIEIEPAYCDVIIQRWMNAFEEGAIRESDGAKYSDLRSAVDAGDDSNKGDQ